MSAKLSKLFGINSIKQEAGISWARERSGRELRRFVSDRHDRLAAIDLALDEL